MSIIDQQFFGLMKLQQEVEKDAPESAFPEIRALYLEYAVNDPKRYIKEAKKLIQNKTGSQNTN